METKIIAAFPGCGKTEFFTKNASKCIDSDSSEFSWIETENGKERNPEFPLNYIEHIKENLGEEQYIFVSSHKEVREALDAEGLDYYLMYPSLDRKDEFLENYKWRGSTSAFVALLDKNWDEWVKQCINHESAYCTRVCLFEGFIADEIEAMEIIGDHYDTPYGGPLDVSMISVV